MLSAVTPLPAMAYTFAAVSGSDASSLMVVYPATPSVATTATEAVTSAAGNSGIGGGGGAEPASDVTTSTNLDDLITSAIKDAAEEGGAEYETDPTAVRAATWAEAKAGIGR